MEANYPDIIELWNRYSPTKRALIKYMFPLYTWRTEIIYSNIEFLIFENCDRGYILVYFVCKSIQCWEKFHNFLQIVFLNLKVLIHYYLHLS